MFALSWIWFFFSEVIGGYLSGSLAIMSDAAHMFSDLASFLISLMAIHLSEKPAKKETNTERPFFSYFFLTFQSIFIVGP